MLYKPRASLCDQMCFFLLKMQRSSRSPRNLSRFCIITTGSTILKRNLHRCSNKTKSQGRHASNAGRRYAKCDSLPAGMRMIITVSLRFPTDRTSARVRLAVADSAWSCHDLRCNVASTAIVSKSRWRSSTAQPFRSGSCELSMLQ